MYLELAEYLLTVAYSADGMHGQRRGGAIGGIGRTARDVE